MIASHFFVDGQMRTFVGIIEALSRWSGKLAGLLMLPVILLRGLRSCHALPLSPTDRLGHRNYRLRLCVRLRAWRCLGHARTAPR